MRDNIERAHLPCVGGRTSEAGVPSLPRQCSLLSLLPPRPHLCGPPPVSLLRTLPGVLHVKLRGLADFLPGIVSFAFVLPDPLLTNSNHKKKMEWRSVHVDDFSAHAFQRAEFEVQLLEHVELALGGAATDASVVALLLVDVSCMHREGMTKKNVCNRLENKND
mmetsp:Transcript_12904/g.17819  ORF Transcript_12904/g.17819 Transcript_12904/m.17819 type:complete len:164 (-) Transcript_12904:606-1097(-)